MESVSMTKKEALQFLHEILKMTSIQEKLSTNKVAFLNEVIDVFQQRIPFQSITTISRSRAKQRISTMDDMKAQMFSSQGGLCYDQNIFMKSLLEALDFDVSLVACDIWMDGIHDHVLLLLKNVIKPGDQYHVDVGVGLPFFQAIPLDFEHESKVYTTGYLTHKFVKEGEVYSWLHKVDGQYRFKQDGDAIGDWKKFMIFTLEPRDIGYFQDPMQMHFVTQNPPKPGHSFLNVLKANSYPGHKFVEITGTSFLVEDETGKITKTKILSKNVLLSLYAEHFPQFPAEMVQVAVEKMNYTF